MSTLPPHVVVTGAGGGIGQAVVDLLLDHGVTVCALDVSFGPGLVEVGTDSGSAGTLYRLGVDVGDAQAVDAAVAEIWDTVGPVGGLVNAAGVLTAASGSGTTDDDWERQFRVNAFGVIDMCRALGPRMAEQGTGSVVTVGSNAGSVPRAGMVAYAASKAAASSVTRSFGLELGPHGVRCNVVSPGTTRTPMITGLGAEADLIRGIPADFKSGIPLGRIADAGDIAGVVVFLTSDGARHVTLQEVVVDGGASQR